MNLSFHFAHIAAYYQELWQRNEFSNWHGFMADDYHSLASIDQTLQEIEGLAQPLKKQETENVHSVCG